jgi:hypothetical protein
MAWPAARTSSCGAMCRGHSDGRSLWLASKPVRRRACRYARRSPNGSTSTATSHDITRRSGEPVNTEDCDLTRPDVRPESPLLLTRAQAAQLCQVSEEILDQWSYEPGFPVIRRNGGHFVRIHRAALERWLEQFALGSNPGLLYSDSPPPAPVRRRVRR